MSALLLFATSVTASVLPLPGSELVILGTIALADGPMRILLVVLAAAAHCIGKLIVYGASAGGARAASIAGPGLLTLRASMTRSRPRAALLVFVSALASVPPLHATTIICGATRFQPVLFTLAVFAARIVRYCVLMAAVDQIGAGI